MCTQIINTQMLKEHGCYEYISGLLAPWLYTLLSLLILIFLCSFPRFLFFLNSKLSVVVVVVELLLEDPEDCGCREL